MIKVKDGYRRSAWEVVKRMKTTMWVFLIVGLIEVLANTFFLISWACGKGFVAAKMFHGDFPKFASDKAWINKVIASLLLGVVALFASFLIHTGNSSQQIVAGSFAGCMLLMCIIEAILYGRKHLPAKLSIFLGLVFVVLVKFRI